MHKLNLALILGGILFVGGCTPLDTEALSLSDRAALIHFTEYEDNVSFLLKATEIRLRAYNVVFSVYNDDYTYRIVYGSTKPTATDPGKISIESPGFQEIYDSSRDGDTMVQRVSDLEDGEFRKALTEKGITFYATSPVYDSKDYLLGYIAVSWTDEKSLWSDIYIQSLVGQVAAEVSSLSKDISKW